MPLVRFSFACLWGPRGFRSVLFGLLVPSGVPPSRPCSGRRLPLAASTPMLVAPEGVLHTHLWSPSAWWSQPLLHPLTQWGPRGRARPCLCRQVSAVSRCSLSSCPEPYLACLPDSHLTPEPSHL